MLKPYWVYNDHPDMNWYIKTNISCFLIVVIYIPGPWEDKKVADLMSLDSIDSSIMPHSNHSKSLTRLYRTTHSLRGEKTINNNSN